MPNSKQAKHKVDQYRNKYKSHNFNSIGEGRLSANRSHSRRTSAVAGRNNAAISHRQPSARISLVWPPLGHSHKLHLGPPSPGANGAKVASPGQSQGPRCGRGVNVNPLNTNAKSCSDWVEIFSVASFFLFKNIIFYALIFILHS